MHVGGGGEEGGGGWGGGGGVREIPCSKGPGINYGQGGGGTGRSHTLRDRALSIIYIYEAFKYHQKKEMLSFN